MAAVYRQGLGVSQQAGHAGWIQRVEGENDGNGGFGHGEQGGKG
ncbi:hypothetical protein [Laribacter hongkongensis]|nr:hypothetical protein [Laribacter hongkongensis]